LRASHTDQGLLENDDDWFDMDYKPRKDRITDVMQEAADPGCTR